MNFRDYVIYELFRPEPSELLASFKVLRRASAIATLIDNRANWSPTLNSTTTIYSEMANLLAGISRQMAATYTQYGTKDKNDPTTFLDQEYRPYLLMNFLQSGKQFYRETISAVEKEIDALLQQQKKKIEPEVFGAWFERALDGRTSKRKFNWVAEREFEKIPPEYAKKDAALLADLYKNSKDKSVILGDGIWKKLQKSRSYGLEKYSQLDALDRQHQEYQKVGYDAIETGKLSIPIVIRRNGTYNLATGESTLQLCSVAEIEPRVIILEICCAD